MVTTDMVKPFWLPAAVHPWIAAASKSHRLPASVRVEVIDSRAIIPRGQALPQAQSHARLRARAAGGRLAAYSLWFFSSVPKTARHALAGDGRSRLHRLAFRSHRRCANGPTSEIVNLDAMTYAGNPGQPARRRRRPALPFRQGDICDPRAVRDAIGRRRRTPSSISRPRRTSIARSSTPEQFLQTDVSRHARAARSRPRAENTALSPGLDRRSLRRRRARRVERDDPCVRAVAIRRNARRAAICRSSRIRDRMGPRC